MDISFSELKNKEVINLFDGKRLGRIIDITIEKESGRVLGFILPGEKKIFKKNEDIFLPLSLIKKIGEDVILVRIMPVEDIFIDKKTSNNSNVIYARYKRVSPKK